MSASILFPRDNTISSWARAGYPKSTRQLSRWANGYGQNFGQSRGEQLETHPGNSDLVAVQGIGGLGHLGVQFAQHMGFRIVAIGRGRDKEKLAKDLGAHVYIDAAVEDVAAV